jgi:hypothetical protein
MDRLFKEFSSEELKELNAVYTDEKVMKTLAGMQHLRSKEGQIEFASFMQTLVSKPITDERKKQLSKLDDSIGMSKNAALLINKLVGIMHSSPNSSTGNAKDIVALAEQEKALADYMSSKIHEGVLLSLAKTHSDLSDKELEEVIGLRTKPAALKEANLRVDNILQAISSDKSKHGTDKVMKSEPTALN